jgi:predicted dehydrogenase
MVRVGIIGLGFMGQTHLKSYSQVPGAKVVALADADAKRASGDFSGGWGNLGDAKTASPIDPKTLFSTTDFHALISHPDVDVVDICTPTPSHVELVEAALAAGKHVIVEKPLARTAADAQRLATAAAKAKGWLMPAMCIRFWPEYAWVKRAVADARFGAVKAASFTRLGGAPPGWFRDGKISGGAILDLHLHDTDFVQYLFGLPKSVMSQGYSSVSGEIDHVHTQYFYDSVPVVVTDGGWINVEGYPFAMKYSVTFERAVVDFELGRKPGLRLIEAGNITPVEVETIDGWVAELRYYVDCVTKGTRPTAVTVEDQVRSIRMIEAESESCRTGKMVTL